MERIEALVEQRQAAWDCMEAAAEMEDRAAWARAAARIDVLEAEIFARFGRKPPYSGGWGGAFAD